MISGFQLMTHIWVKPFYVSIEESYLLGKRLTAVPLDLDVGNHHIYVYKKRFTFWNIWGTDYIDNRNQMPLFIQCFLDGANRLPRKKEKGNSAMENDLPFHWPSKLSCIPLFLVLYLKASQIRNVFFVLATKTLVTRDVLFVGYAVLLTGEKAEQNN